jgi:phosphoribosyl 1,2-cyclic phosphodiesterase
VSDGIFVRFWGVRGSAPVPGPTTLRYGGNTSCVEVRCGPHLIILDAGTGLRALGQAIMRDEMPCKADIFITHPHLDHLLGLPFFAPLYRAESELHLWLPRLSRDGSNPDLITPLIAPPYFPIAIDQMGAALERRPFEPGETLYPEGNLTIKTIGLEHPGGAVGLRLAYQGRTLVYLTDVELCDARIADLATFARDADVLICDAMFTDDEKADHQGWGHTTWQDATRLAQRAAVARLILFHHAPDRTDKALDEIGWNAATLLPGTEVASEGLSLHV